jgi:hypothetical protein
MAQYVVHKIGFFYTDECFVAEQEKGTVIGITKSLEEAQVIKKREDIKSMKSVGGINAVDFFFESDNFRDILKNMAAYYKTAFNIDIDKNAHHFVIPKQMNEEQAAQFLSLLELSFHNIVEYGDDEVINPADYEFDEEEGEISGF